ncbi:MAG: dihydroorotate dehydrogenase [Fusobacteriota bacterium]
MNMKVNIGGVELNNPIMTASGTFGYGDEFKELIDLNQLGGIVVKGTTLKERQGNEMPRLLEVPGGMLNAIGFQNVGVDRFIQEKYPKLKKLDAKTFVNITANTVEEFGLIAKKLDHIDDLGGLEINISCPNIKAGGINMGTDPGMASKVVKEVRKNTNHHIMVKLTPNVTDITKIAKAVELAGADSISLINTLVGLAVDIETKRPKIANVIGGLSGPAIKPVALRLTWEVCKVVDIPVIGMGGIQNYKDVLEFLIVGATAVQVGTANLYNPVVTMEILDDLKGYMEKKGIQDLDEIRGTFKI